MPHAMVNGVELFYLEEPDLFNRTLLDFLTSVDAGGWPRRSLDS